MTAKRHTVTGGILLAAAALSLVPTLREIRVFGFDAGQLPLLACSLAIAGGGVAELVRARRKRREEREEREKQR